MLVFRVEKPDSDQGLWYRTGGVLQPLVHDLGLACASIPMPVEHDEYRRDGIDWFSGCDDLDQLQQWFSLSEMKLLKPLGFKLMIYNTEKVRHYYGHSLFSKQHVVSSQECDLSLLTGE
jgi:hypothetical protein